MNVDSTRQDERFNQLLNMIDGKYNTQTELEESFSPDSDNRLRERIRRQNELLGDVSGSLAWEW